MIEEKEYMSSFENIYCKIAELCGVNFFKKYWHVKGGFNTKKLDKNNVVDLDFVIRDANMFEGEHKSGLTHELLIGILPASIVSAVDYIKTKRTDMLLFTSLVSSGIFVYHGYALMVHKYNKIRANARIKYLYDKMIVEKVTTKKIVPKLYNLESDHLIINSSHDGYTLSIKDFCCHHIDLIFCELYDIERFRNFIYTTEGNSKDKIIYLYNTKKFNSLYEKFITEKIEKN